jgi:hypothetical protein
MKRIGTVLVLVVIVASCTLAVGQGAASKPTSSPSGTSEFTIDEFFFRWNVMVADDAALSVDKTQDSTVICLKEKRRIGGESIDLKPEDAEAVAAALAKTEEHYKAMQGKNDKSETTKAGGCVVRFATTDKGDFYVSVRPDKEFSMSSVQLSRKAAKALAGPMAKAKAMAAFVDRKIAP